MFYRTIVILNRVFSVLRIRFRTRILLHIIETKTIISCKDLHSTLFIAFHDIDWYLSLPPFALIVDLLSLWYQCQCHFCRNAREVKTNDKYLIPHCQDSRNSGGVELGPTHIGDPNPLIVKIQDIPLVLNFPSIVYFHSTTLKQTT